MQSETDDCTFRLKSTSNTISQIIVFNMFTKVYNLTLQLMYSYDAVYKQTHWHGKTNNMFVYEFAIYAF